VIVVVVVVVAVVVVIIATPSQGMFRHRVRAHVKALRKGL